MAHKTGAWAVVYRDNMFFEDEDVRQCMYLPLKMFIASTNIRLVATELWKDNHKSKPSETQLNNKIRSIHKSLHEAKWLFSGKYALQLHIPNNPERDRFVIHLEINHANNVVTNFSFWFFFRLENPPYFPLAWDYNKKFTRRQRRLKDNSYTYRCWWWKKPQI